MRCRLTLAALAAATGTAAADCPTKIEDQPASGLIASATRIAMEDYGIPQVNAVQPKLAAQISAAGGISADDEEVGGTGSLAGMVETHRGGFSACASGDLIDVADGAARVTASTQIPFFFTGLAFGLTLDHQVQLPLAARGDFLRAPLSRIAWQTSISFIDFEMTDEQGNHLRSLIMPFSVEQAKAAQDDGSTTLDRRTTELETAMFRFVASDASGSGTLDFFRFGADWSEPAAEPGTAPGMPPPATMEANGFVRMSPLAVSSDTARWGFELDGGWLGISGPTDCKTVRCYRGFYVGALRHSWTTLSLEGRAERSGFMTPDEKPAFEDRATVTASVDETTRKISASAYAARTASWEGDEVVHRAGLRTTFAQELSHGFSGVLDGELAHADSAALPATSQLAPTSDARLLVSLAWQKRTTHGTTPAR